VPKGVEVRVLLSAPLNMIKSSLEWTAYEDSLLRRTASLTHGGQIRKMVENIRPQVTALSKAEVSARQGHAYPLQLILDKINADIEMVEGFILIAALIG
jgi:hypothetical protein